MSLAQLLQHSETTEGFRLLLVSNLAGYRPELFYATQWSTVKYYLHFFKASKKRLHNLPQNHSNRLLLVLRAYTEALLSWLTVTCQILRACRARRVWNQQDWGRCKWCFLLTTFYSSHFSLVFFFILKLQKTLPTATYCPYDPHALPLLPELCLLPQKKRKLCFSAWICAVQRQ